MIDENRVPVAAAARDIRGCRSIHIIREEMISRFVRPLYLRLYSCELWLQFCHLQKKREIEREWLKELGPWNKLRLRFVRASVSLNCQRVSETKLNQKRPSNVNAAVGISLRSRIRRKLCRWKWLQIFLFKKFQKKK